MRCRIGRPGELRELSGSRIGSGRGGHPRVRVRSCRILESLRETDDDVTRIEVHQLGDPEVRRQLLGPMIQVVGEAYASPEETATGILERNNRCYLSRRDSGEVDGVACCSWGELTVDGEARKALRMGMVRASNYAIYALVRRLLVDAWAWQREVGKVIAWGRTANPQILFVLDSVFADFNPGLDGEYDPDQLPIARAIQELYHYSGPNDHPFILRRIAKHRYAARYRVGTESFLKRHRVPLFERHDVRESEGDRVIYCFRLKRRQTKKP